MAANSKPKQSLFILVLQGCFSLFVFLLLSIFIYFSVFHLSPPSLFRNTQFWFFISNTLILIIAADYATFSPSKHRLHSHLHQEHSFDASNSFSLNLKPPIKEVEEVLISDRERETQELKLQTETPAKTYRRSKSEKAKGVAAAATGSEITVRRSKTVKHEAAEEEKENEFAKMTDEELNRRVEEFIQRFNRQIRGVDT